MKRLILAFTTTLLLASCGESTAPSQSVQAAGAKGPETTLLEGLVALKGMTTPGFNLDATAKANLKIKIENLEKMAGALETFSTNVVRASELLDPIGIKGIFSAYTNMVDRNRELERLIQAAEKVRIAATDYRIVVRFTPGQGAWLYGSVDRTNHLFTLKPKPGQTSSQTLTLDTVAISPGRHMLNCKFDGPGSYTGLVELDKKDSSGNWQMVQVYDKQNDDGISPPGMEFRILYQPPK